MFLTIVIFIIVLGLLIFVHELGHFYTARKSGVKVEEFGFGFPPRIWGIKKGETLYSINWIPLGGFVKIKGESGEHKDERDSFSAQPAWKKSIILSAGVGMNIILAMILLSIGFMIGLPTMIDGEVDNATITAKKIQIVEIQSDSIAKQIGLQLGDSITSIDGQSFSSVQELTDYIANDDDRILNMIIGRADTQVNIEADLTNSNELGVYISETGLVKYSWWRSIIEGIKATFFIFIQIVLAFYNLIKSFFVGGGSGIEIAGPVGVAALTGQMARMGIAYLLQFTALLSINLAIINILPFPALDGGRLLFILIEKIRRKPNNEAVESTIHNIGFIILLLLMFIITYKDIVKYGSGILVGIKNLF